VAVRRRAWTASGVFVGTPMPHQVLETTPRMPSSAKVGTSGSGFRRLVCATARARSLPLAMCDFSAVRSLTIMSTSPERSAIVAGCPPLKGTTRRSAPVSCLKSSAAIWTMVPTPEEAMVYLPGLFFAIATTSLALFAGRPSRTARMCGAFAIKPIRAKSFQKS